MIRFDNVSLERDGRRVLASLDLTLEERRIGVIGANGAGKSSFARLLNGLLRPSAGTVTVEGRDTVREAKAVRRSVGFVFQNPDNQIVYPTVAEDLAFGLGGRGLKADAIDEAVTATLKAFGLDGFGDRLVHELSGGERQLVALAGVTITRPAWLVLDEPTAMLDRLNRRRILATLAGLDARLVVVTHDLDALAGFDRVILLHEGRIAFDGAPEAAFGAYDAITG